MKLLDLRNEGIFVKGWGHCFGPSRYSNRELCDIWDLPAERGVRIEQKTGIGSRASCVDLRTKTQLMLASTMGCTASLCALTNAELAPDAVEAIIGVTTLPEYFCPPLAVRIQKLMGITHCETLDCYGGCGAWAQAVMSAVERLLTGRMDTVLIIAAEVLTRHLENFAPEDPSRFLFGDGAGAVVLSRRAGPLALRRCVVETVAALDGEVFEEVIVAPDLTGTVPPALGESDRFDWAMAKIHHRAKVAGRVAAPLMARAFDAVTTGVDRREIFLVPHQPALGVIDAARSALGLSREQVAIISPTVGNLSTVSVPAAFCECFDEGSARFRYTTWVPIGTGITVGAALFENLAMRS